MTQPLTRCYHWLGRRLASGELVRYVRPFSEVEFQRLANIGVDQGFVVWHIEERECKADSRRVKLLLNRRWVRHGLTPVDPVAALKAHNPARYRLL